MRWALVFLTGCNALLGVHDFGGDAGLGGGDAVHDGIPIDGPAGDWWDPRWSHRNPIAIDNTGLGEDLVKFPVLVRLSSRQIAFDAVEPNGADLRFVSGTTELAHEIDQFDIAETTAWISVAIPKAPAPVPAIWVYYGNPTAVSDGSGAMWEQDLSVHHLGDLTDASGHGHTAVPTGMTTRPTAVAGVIGTAQHFDGVDDELDLMDSNGAFAPTTQLSVSLWLYTAGFTSSYACFVCQGSSTWRLQRTGMAHTAQFGTTTGATNSGINSTSAVDNSIWHHVAATAGAGMRKLYVDGQLQASAAFTSLDTAIAAVSFGASSDATGRELTGSLDEIRISEMLYSGAWIATEYRTVTDPTMVQVGATEVLP